MKERAQKFLKRKLPLLIAVAIYLIFCTLVTGCPIKFLTGIPCPGCGMTRAILSALRLDFAEAFHFHPLFPLAPLFVLYIFFDDALPRGASRGFGIFFAVIFIGTYIFRIFFTKNPVVAIDLDRGFVIKSFHKILTLFGG